MTSRKPCSVRNSSHLPVESFSQIASLCASDGLVVQDLTGAIVWANPAYCNLMGYEMAEILGRNPLAFCMPAKETPAKEDIARFRYDPKKDGQNRLSLFRNRHSSGRIFWNQINQSFYQYPDGTWVCILVCRDISMQILKEQQLRRTSDDLARVAASDTLTGLANRSELMRFLNVCLTRKTAGKLGILQVDLDKFKIVNDHYGHAAGDAMLVHVAEQLRKTIRKGDMAARIGGDEFVVVCPDIGSLEELQILGAAVAQAIGQPVACADGRLAGQACVGAALAHNGETTAEDLMRHADFALYEAKRVGQGAVATYDADLHARLRNESQLSEELMVAVVNQRLTYFFQPTMMLDTGEISGFETLVRWHHPRRGMIPPDAFLPLARKLGLMAEIDFGALRACLSLKQDLNRAGFETVRVGFNASAEVLRHPNFFNHLTDAMLKCDVTPEEVVIEVLESVVIHDKLQANPLIQTIRRLADEGFTTLLDDFGTGHAGLAHLSQLAVSGVKIDRSMTGKIGEFGPDAKIIAMIHDLCQDLGFYVVTEGVETTEDAATLISIGGRIVQGYWLAKPMPRDEIMTWLLNRADLLQEIDRSAIAPMRRHRYLGTNS